MAKASKSSNFFDVRRSVFVGGLDSRVTEEILWELFLQGGPLENVRIPVNKETGKPRAFGFVVYQDACSVTYACELFNSLKLFGRPITCKPQNSDDNNRQENLHQSPIHINFSSDDDTLNHRKSDERNGTPTLNVNGDDNSPYGRTPNMSINRPRPLLERTRSAGASPLPLMGLQNQVLFNHSFPNWMGNGGHHDLAGSLRREGHMNGRMQSHKGYNRWQRPRPY